MVKTDYSISAFFPVYQDEKTVEMMAIKTLKVLESLTKDYELIIVDDASPDHSGQMADNLAKKYKKVRVIHHKINKGYGGALRTGFNAATKELIFYTDGDAQYDPKELELLIRYMIPSIDIVNGYKTYRADPFIRKALGSLYNQFVRVLFLLDIWDVDCDFRLIRKRIFDKIRLKSNDGLICLEFARKIKNAGFKAVNVPVHHYPRISGGSTFFNFVNLFKVISGLIVSWFDWVLFKKYR